jgi:hypothetical protein
MHACTLMHWCCKGLLLNRVRFQPLNIDVVLGAFNNYVDQILSNFDHLPPSFYIILTLCSCDQAWTYNCHLPTSSCPHSYWMPPFSAFEIRETWQFSGSLGFPSGTSSRVRLQWNTRSVHYWAGWHDWWHRGNAFHRGESHLLEQVCYHLTGSIPYIKRSVNLETKLLRRNFSQKTNETPHTS